MPGTDTQVHDFNGRIASNGLFWTVRIPDDALDVDGKKVHLCIEDLPVADSFVFLGPTEVPAKVSFDVTWRATSGKRDIEPSSSDPLDPGNFEGRFRFAEATGEFSAKEAGFELEDAEGTSAGLFAEFGTERNGVFAHDASAVARR